MARSHAKIRVAVWGDPGYAGALTIAAQWLYTHLLAHPRLTLVGTIDLAERRWARLAVDSDEDVIESALVELEAARLLLIDWDTEEVMVRTFTAHDLAPGRVNKNLAAGFWRAWEGVLSPALRSCVAHEAPEALWDALAEHAPPEALETRRSPRLEPEPRPRLEPPPELRSQPTPTPTPTPPSSQQTSPSSSSSQSVIATRPDLAESAVVVVGERRHLDAVEAGNVQHPASHRKACITGAHRELIERAHGLAHEHPDWTPEQIADRLTRVSVPLGESRHPAVVAQALREASDGGEEPVASQEAVSSLAAQARAHLAGSLS